MRAASWAATGGAGEGRQAGGGVRQGHRHCSHLGGHPEVPGEQGEGGWHQLQGHHLRGQLLVLRGPVYLGDDESPDLGRRVLQAPHQDSRVPLEHQGGVYSPQQPLQHLAAGPGDLGARPVQAVEEGHQVHLLPRQPAPQLLPGEVAYGGPDGLQDLELVAVHGEGGEEGGQLVHLCNIHGSTHQGALAKTLSTGYLISLS